MLDSFDKGWFVLQTYSGYENKVKSNLESRAESMGMEDYIFRVVVPEEEKHEVTKTGKEKIETLVLGLPKNMNNSLGFASERSLNFKKLLEEKIDKEVILIDERL